LRAYVPTRDGSNFIAKKVAIDIANFDVLPHLHAEFVFYHQLRQPLTVDQNYRVALHVCRILFGILAKFGRRDKYALFGLLIRDRADELLNFRA